MNTLKRALVMAVTAFTMTSINAQDTNQTFHQHGVVDFSLKTQRSQLYISIKAPGENVVGYEGNPTTIKQIQALSDALNKFRQSQTLFKLPEAAQCSLKNQRLVNATPSDQEEGSHQTYSSVSKENKSQDKEHSEFIITYTYNCEELRRLDKIMVTWFDIFPDTKKIKVRAFNRQVFKLEKSLVSSDEVMLPHLFIK